MESVGAARMFIKYEFQHDPRYMNYLGDEDSSSFKSVQCCGDECPITTMECIGHVQKRVGSLLRKLKTAHKGKKLSDGKCLCGIGRLTKVNIDFKTTLV